MSKRLWTIAASAVAVAIVAAGAYAMLMPNPAVRAIRIGYAISFSGVNKQGAAITVLPNYRLWLKQINAAGGIAIGEDGRRLPVEVIEYDDESRADKAIELVDRLISVDKVDFILPPWGTGLNMAVAPLLNRAGYPHLAVTALHDQPAELARKWPSSFWFLGTMTDTAQALAGMLADLRRQGKIGQGIAIASVADQLGIGLDKATRTALGKAGFEIVYDRAYAVGEKNMSPIVEEAKALAPDVFLCFSYPPDTMAITQQARRSGFNPKLFYAAIGTAYPTYKGFGTDIEGVLGSGGWNPDTEQSRHYAMLHVEATGQEPDGWASPITYASLQILQQAIERNASLDRAAIIETIRDESFDTIVGQVQLVNNIYQRAWLIGQWQSGEFHGIAPLTLAGARPLVFPKPAWGSNTGAPINAFVIAPEGFR